MQNTTFSLSLETRLMLPHERMHFKKYNSIAGYTLIGNAQFLDSRPSSCAIKFLTSQY